MDKQALEYVIGHLTAGTAAERVLEHTADTAIALPLSVKVEDLESYLPLRRRFRGAMRTSQIAEFAEYSNLAAGEVHSSEVYEADGAACFVDPDNMTARTFFNLGTLHEPGHGDHTANLTLPKTAAFEELLSKNGKAMDQKELAEWLEDWSPQLKVTAENGEPLSLPGAVAAVRRITISANSESTNEERTFGGRRSAMSEVEAQNKDTLPAFIEYTCEPYHGLDERTFRLRVSLITGETPRLIMRIVRLEHHQEEMAKEFREHLVHALDGDLVQTFVGSFQP